MHRAALVGCALSLLGSKAQQDSELAVSSEAKKEVYSLDYLAASSGRRNGFQKKLTANVEILLGSRIQNTLRIYNSARGSRYSSFFRTALA